MLNRRHLLIPGPLSVAGCSATGTRNALVPRSTYRLQEGIAYGPFPRQRLDAHLPECGARDAPLVSWRAEQRAARCRQHVSGSDTAERRSLRAAH